MDEDIKKYADTIAILREECKQKDADIHKAAIYGHQLLKENSKIKAQFQNIQAQIELLKQEKYSLQLSLESQTQNALTQTTELEIQTKTAEDLKENVNFLQKQAVQQRQRYDNLEKEKNYLETSQQDLQLENTSLKNKIQLLEKQVEALQDSIKSSMNETEIVEDTRNVSMYITKSKELEDTLAEVQKELRISKLNESSLTKLVKELEETVAEQHKELSSYSKEIQREKEFSSGLQCEIEVLKLDQLDPKQRGNSMFAELDDRRKLVEKEYKLLSKKYENVLKNYEENKKELTNCKVRMAILQSKTSKQCQDEYIKNLENMLSSARREVEDLTFKFTKAKKYQMQQRPIETLTGDKYDYLRVMKQQAEQKVKDAENELMTALMKVKSLNDNLFEYHQDMYKVKKDFSDLKTENLKLKQEIKELTFKPDSEAPEKPIPVIEIKPGCESNPETLKFAEAVLKEYNQQPNDDIIPGELMLGENGFVEVKAPRLSTKAMLRDCLHKLNTRKSVVQTSKETLNKIKEDMENCPNEIKTEPSVKPTAPVNHNNCPNSPVNPNNCAQQ